MSEAKDTLEAGIERYRKTLDNNAAVAADIAEQAQTALSAPGEAGANASLPITERTATADGAR